MLNQMSVRLSFAVALILFFTAAGDTQPASRDRILSPIDAAQTAVLKGTAHPVARAQSDQGRTDTTRRLSGVTLTFRLSPAQQADLDQLLRDQQNLASPQYHKWITPAQYAVRFGMTQSDLAKVASWAQSQGLTVDAISPNRTEVSFSGTVGQIEYALKTELHNYSVNGEQHFANATDVALPAAFASQVLSVRGLNDFSPKPRLRRPAPRFTSSLSGSHFLIPGDFATIYDLPSAYDGSGQSIAVIGQTLISTTDIDAFRSAAGLPARTAGNFQQIQASNTGSALTCSGDGTEADLDLEWPQGVAKNVTIKYVYAGVGVGGTCSQRNADVFDALHYAITANVAPIISISYGNCESALTTPFVLTMQQWAQQANAQGQTISGPAGDQGAADCESATATSATHGLAVDVPASIPEVTGVGGTEFNATLDPAATADPNNANCFLATTYWSRSCGSSTTVGNPTGASALSYIPETTWNDVGSSQGFSVGGGGASSVFSKPSWQTGTGVPGDSARDVPDIALSGSNGHDAYLICSQDFFTSATPPVSLTSCPTAGSFRASDGKSLEAIGGTSADAPTFAGILALINQATASNGLGNVNPMLYQLAANTSNGAFHDITSGTNKVPCTTGTPNCPSGTTSIGFTAGTGYDQVTGLGSLDVSNLIAAWKAATVTADFSLDGLTATISTPGASGSSTVTVSALNGFTGTVNLTCAPSSATVHITCSLTPPSVSLTGSPQTQTSVLNITTVAARLDSPPGTHPSGIRLATGGSTLFAALVLCGVPSRRRRQNITLGLFVIMIASLSMIVACGGGSSNSNNQNHGTPAGTYSITVTGTGPSTTHSATVKVSVL
jgi:subtilase family serine protease